MKRLQIRVPPKSPKELLAEAEERFRAAVNSLEAMPMDTPAALLGYLHAIGAVAAAMTDDLRRVTHERRFGMRMLHDLGKGLGESRPTLLACAELCRSYSAEALGEIAGRACSIEELADLVDLGDPDIDKRLLKRLRSAGRPARRGRSPTGKQGRRARRSRAG